MMRSGDEIGERVVLHVSRVRCEGRDDPQHPWDVVRSSSRSVVHVNVVSSEIICNRQLVSVIL